MSQVWDGLLPKLEELHDLYGVLRLLQWDQAVMMPPRGAPGRARMVATVEAEAHRRLTDPAIGEAISELVGDDSLNDLQRASARVLKRDYELATRLPEDLVRALAEARGIAYQAWTEARPASDFSLLQPHLELLVSLKKEEADALGGEDERYDALLDQFEPGMKTSDVSSMFSGLVAGLQPILDTALGSDRYRPDFLFGSYDELKQESFCKWLVERVGFDTKGGRLDQSPHPFTTGIGKNDVRQTTRTHPTNMLGAIYAALHETGHALYEQGIPTEWVDLPAGRVPSLGLHESQSRLWENQVGRSRAFTDFLLPHLKDAFPEPLGMASPEEFYWGVNLVERTPIRVHADELTYNLHVALRFELEVSLFRDQLDVADLPTAWNEGMLRHLGIRPESDAVGVLQDMHWSIGAYGYFPTYTLGNLYAAAIFRKAVEELGDLTREIRGGETGRLLEWLRSRVHKQAYLHEAKDLILEVVGESVTAAPLLDYLTRKFASY